MSVFHNVCMTNFAKSRKTTIFAETMLRLKGLYSQVKLHEPQQTPTF